MSTQPQRPWRGAHRPEELLARIVVLERLVAGCLKAENNLSDVADQQTALDTLTDVAGATNEHALKKDTGTGNAVFKA